MTVGDLMWEFCPKLDVLADPKLLYPGSQGTFKYSALYAICIVVADMDATDTKSLAVALHEIAHFLRYEEGVPYYQIPHKIPRERAEEKIEVDKRAISLAEQVFGLSSPIYREIEGLLTVHTEKCRTLLLPQVKWNIP